MIFKWPFGNDGDPAQLRHRAHLHIYAWREGWRGSLEQSVKFCSSLFSRVQREFDCLYNVCKLTTVMFEIRSEILFWNFKRNIKNRGLNLFVGDEITETKICVQQNLDTIFIKLSFVQGNNNNNKKKTFIINGLLSWLFVENFQKLLNNNKLHNIMVTKKYYFTGEELFFFSFFIIVLHFIIRGIIVNVIRLIL